MVYPQESVNYRDTCMIPGSEDFQSFPLSYAPVANKVHEPITPPPVVKEVAAPPPTPAVVVKEVAAPPPAPVEVAVAPEPEPQPTVTEEVAEEAEAAPVVKKTVRKVVVKK